MVRGHAPASEGAPGRPPGRSPDPRGGRACPGRRTRAGRPDPVVRRQRRPRLHARRRRHRRSTGTRSSSCPAPATISADVYDWEGVPIAALLPSPSTTFAPGPSPIYWDGFGAPNGPYLVRLVARTDAGSFTRDLQVARVAALPYPVNPGAVAIFLDPGHGGDAPGGTEARLPDGTLIREEVLNLDIALKARGDAARSRHPGLPLAHRGRARRTPPASTATATARSTAADDYLARIDGANRATCGPVRLGAQQLDPRRPGAGPRRSTAASAASVRRRTARLRAPSWMRTWRR